MLPSPKPVSIDQYLASFPAEIQARLTQVRQVVLQVVPQGEERISYGMPAMFQKGVVVYYAAFKKHLGLYPPVHDPALRKKVARYAGPKGNLQFPFTEPLPLDLIAEVVRSRLQENLAKIASKK